MNPVWDQAAAEADLTLKLPGGVEMFFRKIPASAKAGFRMGSRGNDGDEEPVHRVRIPHDFYLGTFVVTQAQYAAVAAEVPGLRERAEPSDFKGARHPVEQVDWREANQFCDWLTRNVAAEELPPGGSGRFCLPTEAEWEYGCRGGAETEYHNGDGEAALAEVGWYDGNSGDTTHAVDEPVDGRPERHPFGLIGMHGNVRQWCHDVYDGAAYRQRVDGDADPGVALRGADWQRGLYHIITPGDGRVRVLRGGSWFGSAGRCRSAYRCWRMPVVRLGSRRCRSQRQPGSGERPFSRRSRSRIFDPSGHRFRAIRTLPASSFHDMNPNSSERVINWAGPDAENFNRWDAYDTGKVEKMVIGPSPGSDQDKGIAVRLPDGFAERFPNLTHLHLWQITGLQVLPALPPKLKCLDVRGCKGLVTLPELPAGLETLVLERCPKLSAVADIREAGLPALTDLSVKGCTGLKEDRVHRLLRSAPALRRLDASGCPQLTAISRWPATLQRIDLDECTGLVELPASWPRELHRLGLRGARALARLEEFEPHCTRLDHLDLAGTSGLKTLPELRPGLRTLFLHGSGVAVAPELLGQKADENVAARVLAYQQEAGRGLVPDHEVKVILLGNGRCGKSSLVRRLVDDPFDEHERSTHGIRLRTLGLDFQPVDDPAGPSANATLNLWDFAGQDLYHNTHRTFLQSKAVYVVCCTNHCDGADPAGDKTPDPDAEAGDDVRRSLRYWLEQIASLGNVPGTDAPPPVLLVRMKADRDTDGTAPLVPWANCEAGAKLARFDVSARDGKGIAEFKQELSRAVARVLGVRERRSLGRRPMKVKDELRPLKLANEAAFQQGEKTRHRVPSPHPTLRREEFDVLVRRHCPDSDYARDPGLLLTHLHLSGFLYYDAHYLPEIVILDQPWALEAVYTVMHRGRCHPRLKAAGGKFNPEDLAAWAWSPDDWNPAGYTLEEQALFLRFMESHRVVAELFRADETNSGQPRYVAPYYLPEWATIQPAVTAREKQHGAVTARATVASPYLGRDVAQGLVIDLVRRFSRSAEVWKWGAHFAAAGLPAAVTLKWSAADVSERFGGQITAEYRGAEAARLHEYVVARLRELPLFPADAEVEYQTVRSVPPTETRKAPATLATRAEAIEPADRAAALGVRVGLSYAGSDPAGATEAERNLGALPQGLKDHLVRKKIRVLEYSDQYRESNLPKFTDELIRQDYLVVFLSGKYLRSPYCMWELMLLFSEPPPRVFPPGRTYFLVLPGVPVSGDAALMQFATDWDNHWKLWCEARQSAARTAAGDDTACLLQNLGRIKAAPWYEFARKEDLRESLLRSIFADCFKVSVTDPAAFQPATEGFRQLVERYGQDLVDSLGQPETVYHMAARLWQRAGLESLPGGRKEMLARAKQLYYRARRLAPGFNETTDIDRMRTEPHQSSQMDVEELLEELRRACLGDIAARGAQSP